MERNITIDFLRFCGVILVMFNHTYIVAKSSLFDKIINRLTIGGWIGVDLFFVLSGYLVSTLIFNEFGKYSEFNGGRFLIRRGLKIYPTYYFFLICSLIYNTCFLKVPFNSQATLGEAIFISNYTGFFNSIHLWSICIEEHFYIFLTIYSFLLIKYSKLSLKNISLTYLLLFGVATGFKIYNYAEYHNYVFERDCIKSHLRFDALFFGVLLAALKKTDSVLIKDICKHAKLLLPVSIVYLSSNFVFTRDSHPFLAVTHLILNPVFFGIVLLIAIQHQNNLINFCLAPMAAIGKYSYSIYLFHPIANQFFIKLFPAGGLKYYLSFFFFSVLLGISVGKLIEYPMLKIRDKYFPRRSKIIVA